MKRLMSFVVKEIPVLAIVFFQRSTFLFLDYLVGIFDCSWTMLKLLYTVLVFSFLVASSMSFMAQFEGPRHVVRSRSFLSMRAKPENLHSNMARKYKRKLRSADATTFPDLCTPEFEDFLKNKAPPGIYNSIYPKFLKIARQLKVAIQPDFGIRPKIEHPSIFETMQASGNYSIFLNAFAAAQMEEVLGGSLITVLAPTDEAFAKLESGVLEELLGNGDKLKLLLQYHLIDGSNNSKKITALNGKSLNTMNGGELPVKVGKQDQVITLGPAKIITANIKCKNGVFHSIDTVLFPPQ